MPMTANSLQARDAKSVVHGLTNLHLHAKRGATVIQSGEGVWVKDSNGKSYLEAMSGLWCISLGYGNKRLAEVAYRQMQELAYYPLTNHKSHPPVIALAEKLLSIAPCPMARIWFASTGSEANDCAARLSWYYWNAVGKPNKSKFISHKLAYHGNTIASGSLSGVTYAHKRFNLPLPGFFHVDTPHFTKNAHKGETEQDFVARLLASIEHLIESEDPETIAAFFVEPVMGAGGIVVPPDSYYEGLQKLLKKFNILLVCDEVVTAFGRTGNMFGSTTMQLEPDLLICAKALSSAYIPISALMINQKVYEAIERQSGELGLFGLTMTYSGHPVASAVALETLKIYEELNIVGHVRTMSPLLLNGLQKLSNHPLVREVRGIGLLAGVELTQGYGVKCAQVAEELGLIVRAIGDTIAFCPPLIIQEDEVGMLLQRFEEALNSLNES
ncbi:MAG: aminotransferase [Burkholderiaceae bacterium]